MLDSLLHIYRGFLIFYHSLMEHCQNEESVNVPFLAVFLFFFIFNCQYAYVSIISKDLLDFFTSFIVPIRDDRDM